MTSLDLRQAFNALSDVVVNRPPPLRKFDQIYMKISDMLLQVEHISRWVDEKSVVCIGDGDAIGLALVHLKDEKVFECGPKQVHILDFDERVVNSIKIFAENHQLEDQITAELYNVADPLPKNHVGRFEAFYTNPPFGASNDGRSVGAFLKRGDEALAPGGTGCLVVAADSPLLPWTTQVMKRVQMYLLTNGYTITEIIPQFHHYHLDDNPDLTSCSIIAVRDIETGVQSNSEPLPQEVLKDFYGASAPLRVRYVRDLREDGKLPDPDHCFEFI